MAKLPEEVTKFFNRQHFVIVSTVDADGTPHNLERNPAIGISAVDEHKFKGYSLKGRASIMKEEKLRPHIIKAWEDRLAARITHRLIKNLKGEQGHGSHPEAQLPKPKYLIAMAVTEIVDLTPPPLR